MRLSSVRFALCSGRELSGSELGALIQLREQVMRLRPGTDQAADRSRVERFVRSAQFIHRIVDAEDSTRLLGVMAVKIHETNEGRGPLLFRGEYGYVVPELRGRPESLMLFARVSLTALWHARGRESWAIGLGAYPLSYRQYRRFGRVSGHTRDGQLPAEIREAITSIAAEHYGQDWDSERHVVRLNTLPSPLPTAAIPRFRNEAWWDEYHEVCPSWREGEGLVIYMRLSVADVLWSLGQGVRARRGGRPGSRTAPPRP